MGNRGRTAKQPLEDRALKAAAQFMGQELLPFLGIEGTMKRIAPTEQVHMEIRDLMEDFNFEMEDGTWKHLEFESDRITKEDLRRFRAYEAVLSYQYKVEVSTYVICSFGVPTVRCELREGFNLYRVQVIRMKEKDVGPMIEECEKKQKEERLCREDLIKLLLVPLMGGEMSQPERIQRCLNMVKKEKESLGREDMARMQAVLYALAMKFLTPEELMEVKEGIKMTILGEMIRQDGIEEGMEKGIEKGMEKGVEKGIQALVESCREFGVPSSEIILKLIEKFEMTKEEAEERYRKYCSSSNTP